MIFPTAGHGLSPPFNGQQTGPARRVRLTPGASADSQQKEA